MLFRPTYNLRRALVIGINKYKNVSPLSHATNDADAIAEILKTKFNFDQDEIVILQDDMATKDNIIQQFHGFTQNIPILNRKSVSRSNDLKVLC